MRLRRDIDADEVPRPLPKPPAPSDCSDGSDIDDILMGAYIFFHEQNIFRSSGFVSYSGSKHQMTTLVAKMCPCQIRVKDIIKDEDFQITSRYRNSVFCLLIAIALVSRVSIIEHKAISV